MGKHQYEGLIRSIMPLHVQCYCMLTPVVKYNCMMFLLKYKTTHKYTITTKIFLYFFQKCCSLYITANTTECVNDLHRTNNKIQASTVNKKKKEKCKIKKDKKLLHPVLTQDNIDNVLSEIDLHSVVNVVAFCVSGLGICVQSFEKTRHASCV